MNYMVVGVGSQNRGLLTLSDSSRLELMVLDPSLPEEDITAFVTMQNEAWGFHAISNETFRRRLERGILVGGYLGNEPAALLETTSLNLEGVAGIEKTTEDPRERAYGVARLLHGHAKDYNGLTNDGEWFADENGSNVLVMVDLTVPKRFAGKGLFRPQVSYFKTLMLGQDGFQRPGHLKDVRYILSFSPKPNDYSGPDYKGGIVLAHTRIGGAFNTGYVWENARPGHPEPDVVMMCYMAPGYVPRIGMTIQRVSTNGTTPKS